MHNNINTDKFEVVDTLSKETTFGEDYSEILNYYKLEYKIADYYLQVGEIVKTQGWILHLSIVISQVDSSLTTLIPVLISEKVPFKIPMNKETCRNLLLGYLGKSQVGKIVCIYPENDTVALLIAKKLVKLTNNFKGPTIPTDIHLGNIVYTRYGSFNPVMLPSADGKEERYIYNDAGQLTQDIYTIPFQLPSWVTWPFTTLASPIAPAPKRILKNIYKPLTVLKSDLKGDVSKGLYLKGILRIIPCVIKQGRKHMVSEDSGRDMYDRLQWQQELYSKLSDTIPLPKIFDFFQEDDDSYLVMEFIKGVSFTTLRKKLNPNYREWSLFKTTEAVKILDHLIRVIIIIENLHHKGFVHRDIAPNNFLIDKTENVYLIDIELAYSLQESKPNPPFQLGTPGFMSPEQQLALPPTLKEDVYGLGAFITEMLTGLSPIRFDVSDDTLLFKKIYFFTQNEDLARTITASLNPDPQLRPTLSQIHSSLDNYRHQLLSNAHTIQPEQHQRKLNITELKDTITSALEGLNKPPVVILDDFWYSKVSIHESLAPIQNLEYTRYTGIREGLGGVLYLLARAQKMGFNIDSSINGYSKSWDFLESNHFSLLPNTAPGLYEGSAGVALALAEGIKSGLLEDNNSNRYRLEQCLDIPNTNLDLAGGITGQGIALLQCGQYMNTVVYQKLQNRIIETLLNAQQNDGSWIFDDSPGKKISKLNVGFGRGTVGIIWFLLAYLTKHKNIAVQKAALKSLGLIAKRTHDLKDLFATDIFKKKILYGNEKGDERKGILLTFIKAYEALGDDYYKKLVELALIKYPSRMVKNDFTQESGLAGLGEIYLEAFHVFKNQEWKERADWISNVYIHTHFKNPDGSGYWIMDDNNNIMTADFMLGLSGIIHFLLRCLNPEKLGYRLIG